MKRSMKVFVFVLVALVVSQGVFGIRLWRAAHAIPRTAPIVASAPALYLAQEAGDWNNMFLGVPLLQFPNDLMTYQRLLFDVKPDIVIETGTFRGGLTLYLAMLLENINDQGRVLSVDIDDTGIKAVLSASGIRASLKDRIRFFGGSSTDAKIVEQIAALAK